MANELATQGQIDIIEHDGISTYNADKQAMNRIKALSDKDFEKEISQFSEDTQMFMRMARYHGMD